MAAAWAAGAQLGAVIDIREATGGARVPLQYVAAELDRSVPIRPGTSALTVSVVITWSLG